ncbi:MAG: hypothetical protein K5840_02885 [Eubacterium sp.]|nr:hypothetical protein [Eubacterium sp.]
MDKHVNEQANPEAMEEVFAEIIRSWMAQSVPSGEDEECEEAAEPAMTPERLEEIISQRESFEKEKKEFDEKKRAFEKALRDFEIQKTMFEREVASEKRRQEQQQNLFETKWKILEEELIRFSKEKEEFELHKEFRSKVNEFEKREYDSTDYEIFFSGIDNELALRKRYKDLIKIFHPDNLCGDVDTVQEINREYDALKLKYS